MNRAIIMGRLTADPELKQTPGGTYVTSFSVAVNRDYSTKDGERQTDFIDVVAWRQTAEFITRYFKKGNMIAVEGSIQTRSYEDKNGNKRKAVEIIASQVHFCGSKKESDKDNTGTTNNSGSMISSYDFEEIDTPDEDLPF